MGKEIMNEQSKSIDFTKFAKNMGTLRAAKGWSAKEASRLASLRNLSRWECIEYGRGTPNLEEVYNISKVLGHSIDDMLNRVASVSVRFEEVSNG